MFTVTSYGGAGAMITSSNTSFLSPIIASYAGVIGRRVIVNSVTAVLFTISCALDLFRSERRWLKASRIFGFFGAVAVIVSVFLGFTPDYVHQVCQSVDRSAQHRRFCFCETRQLVMTFWLPDRGAARLRKHPGPLRKGILQDNLGFNSCWVFF